MSAISLQTCLFTALFLYWLMEIDVVDKGVDMNFERISFRTNEKERQLLAQLNERYRCKTVTSLMHKFLEEAASNGLVENNQSNAAKIFGDMDIMNISPLKPHPSKEDSPQTENPAASRSLIDPSLITTFNLKSSFQGNETKKEVEEKSYDPYEEFLKEVYDLERLKQAIERTIPNRMTPNSFHAPRPFNSNEKYE